MEIEMGRESVDRTFSARRASPTALSHHPTSFQKRHQIRSSLEGAKDPSISTASPFQSPISPTFAPTIGLAPRPSSYVHNGENDKPAGSRSKRQDPARDSQPYLGDTRKIEQSVLQSADVDRAAFSTSFENIRRNGLASSQHVSSGHVSSGRPSTTHRRDDVRSRKAPGTFAVAVAPSPARVVQVDTHRRQDTAVAQNGGDRRLSQEDYRTQQAQSRQFRSSTQQRREWAPDKSPLQKLELTLQDITKEEKRAQVEEAELLLREAKAGRGQRSGVRRTGREVSDGDRLSEVGGVSAHLAEAGLVRNLSNRQRERIQSTTIIESRKPSVTQRFSGHDFQYEEQEYHQPISNKSPGRAVSDITNEEGRNGQTRVVSESNSDRKIASARAPAPRPRPGSDRSPEMGSQTSRQLPPAQKQLYAERVSRSQTLDSSGKEFSKHSQESGGDVEISELRADPGIAQKPTAPFSPKSGPLSARIGSFRDEARADNQATPAPNGHHLTHHLPHRIRNALHGKPEVRFDVDSDPQPLQEWKRASTARISVSRIEEPERRKSWAGPVHDEAWWEKHGTGARTAVAGMSSGPQIQVEDVDMPARGGITDGQNGMNLLEILSSEDAVADHLPEMEWRKGSSVKPRPRPDLLSPSHAMLERARFMRRNKSQGDKIALAANWRSDNAQSLITISTSPYSPSCPLMHEHDVFHPFHVCPLLVDKGLTKSMRSIRVRLAAEPNTFQPPLYLKCGPLLRYLGIRNESPRSGLHAVDRPRQCEVWRGSVMIVTTDSMSSYETPPTLRLFLQPTSLLPPPPAQFDDDGGELPQEYVDPIAGLPVLSRTGQTMYVKPVEHLEEEKDLSQIETDDGLFEEVRSPPDPVGRSNTIDSRNRSSQANMHGDRISAMDGEKQDRFQDVKGIRLHTERGLTFWRFSIEVELGERQSRVAYRINRGPAIGFWVPGRGETMNIMFHSCNGFNLSVNPDLFSGPDPMWRDVLNTHQTRPFHVMIGGGDQIYNDVAVKQTTAFQDWLMIKNPLHKYNAKFSTAMKNELETFYLERYAMWFSQGLFGVANSQIPMVNMWDDHDIIDGFGSYPDHFMRSPVFSGLGNVAFKYYMLFQHQSVAEEMEADEPSWVLGRTPGPYIHQLSRSVFMSLGCKVALLGLDCRTERTREEVVMEQTYGAVFDRCKEEIIKGETKHLIVLLGIPIAYPRLVWLENILTSRMMDPLKAIGKSGLLGSFLNQFDGGVEILDDLDDHWTSRNHKHERNWFIEELQALAADKSVRVTILGGDVHLAAMGQFYSNPRLGIPKDRDHRYMPNVISSAIVNTPPPVMLSDVLNKRNKVHHLNSETDEDMIPMFTHDVDGTPRNNKHLLPRRNWCSIREYHPGATPPGTPPPEVLSSNGSRRSLDQASGLRPGFLTRTLSQLTRRDSVPTTRSPSLRPATFLRRLSQRGRPAPRMPHTGTVSTEETTPSDPNRPPTVEAAATESYIPQQLKRSSTTRTNRTVDEPPQRPTPFHRQTTGFLEGKKRAAHLHGHVNLEAGLDIVLNVEVSQKDPAGITMPYRLLVPALDYEDETHPLNQSHIPRAREPDRENEEQEGGGEGEGMKRRWTGLSRIGSVRRRLSLIPGLRGGGGNSYADEMNDDDDHYNVQGRGEFDGHAEYEPRGIGKRLPQDFRPDGDATTAPSNDARRPGTSSGPVASPADQQYGYLSAEEEDEMDSASGDKPLFGEIQTDANGRQVADQRVGARSIPQQQQQQQQSGLGRQFIGGGGGRRAKW